MSYTLTGADGWPYTTEVKGQWGGYKRAKIYGRLDCPSALRAITRGGYVRYCIFFADEATAIAATLDSVHESDCDFRWSQTTQDQRWAV